METNKIEVLLIRKGQTGRSPLSNRLTTHGCACRFATSPREVASRIANLDCDLILAPIRLDGDTLYPLIGRLSGSRATLFYYLPVEDGCWWLPALWFGANCFGAPAIHNREFVTVLDETIEEMRFRTRQAVEPLPLLPSQPSVSTIAFPFPRRMLLPTPPMNAKILTVPARRAAG